MHAHCHIANKIHYARDTLPEEDRRQPRPGHGPENMATLRNTALNRLRATGTNTTEAVPDLSYEPFTAPLNLLERLPMTSRNLQTGALRSSVVELRVPPAQCFDANLVWEQNGLGSIDFVVPDAYFLAELPAGFPPKNQLQ